MATTPTTASNARNQLPRRNFDGMSTEFQTHYNQLVDTVNTLSGYNGPIPLNNHINLQGNQIQNLGAPTSGDGAVSQSYAQSNYSASAIRPQLEGNGSQPLQTVRQLNSKYQRESTSSYMNNLMSTTPNATAAQVTFDNGTGTTSITVNPTTLALADGTVIPISGRTDTVSNPVSITITMITAAGSTGTVTTETTHGLIAGDVIYIAGNTESIFNAVWTVSSVTGTDTFTIEGDFGTNTITGTGGTLSLGGVYYYVAVANQSTMAMMGPYASDTPQNRLQANLDGTQIVAVAVVTNSGGVPSQSGGGGTPTIGAANGGTFF